jgi:hypothetical protein
LRAESETITTENTEERREKSGDRKNKAYRGLTRIRKI